MTTDRRLVIELFAGCGGASLGIHAACPDDYVVGLETNKWACATRRMTGLPTVRCDVTQFPVETLVDRVRGLWASPPCPDFSAAGRRKGVDGVTGHLIYEVPRWVELTRPTWVACEQVPEVLPYWKIFRDQFRAGGYSAWAGILCAADYGVPQERYRAILMASRERVAQPPVPTHAESPQTDMFTGRMPLPWVTMAAGLGWGTTNGPCPTVTSGGARTGGAEPIARGGRERLAKDAGEGHWILKTNRDQRPDGSRQERKVGRSAPTLTGESGGQWQWERPATTIVSSFRPDIVSPPTWRKAGDGPRQNQPGATKITVEESLILQGFPRDFPVQGSRTRQFEQVGNAVPPILAQMIVLALVNGD